MSGRDVDGDAVAAAINAASFAAANLVYDVQRAAIKAGCDSLRANKA